jgi:hypothetical protein
MGIFDFFKSKKEEPKKSKIKFDELEGWIENKTQVNKEKEQKIIKTLNSVISETASVLSEQNSLLQNIDLKDRKEQEKLKGIVIENLAIYSHHVSRLIENLRNLKKESLEEMLSHLNKIVLEFKQRSSIHFEKATILVGKELGDIKETLSKFSNELNDILKEDKETLDSLKTIILVKNKLNEIKKFEEVNKSIIFEVKKIDDQLKKLQGDIEMSKKNMEKIKSGVKYEMHQKEKENAKIMKNELEKEISDLRNLIDFKKLSGIYHSDSKKMQVIKEYEMDFNRTFEKNDERIFLNLIDDSKKFSIIKKIQEIQETKLQIQEILGRKDLLETDALEIMKINTSIRTFESDKLKIQKKSEEFEKDIAKVKEEIKNILLPIGVEIE